MSPVVFSLRGDNASGRGLVHAVMKVAVEHVEGTTISMEVPERK